MAAFSFEKISAPVRPNPTASIDDVEKKPRGVIIQMLDRFVEARVKRTMPKDGAYVRFPKNPAK